ncbi:restriction endonuclease [Streptomyces sp. NPDC058579]|uniref:restriction endonuclease n=1 Tax=Streptomyces sp. NPDC058579 TaxID=3346548 RepID=UPI00365D3AB6
MKTNGEGGRTGVGRVRLGRGSTRIGRDLVLAIGLAGILGCGLALFVKTAQVAGNRGSGVPVAVLVGLALLGVLAVGPAMVRRRRTPAQDHDTFQPLDVPDDVAPTLELPDVGTEALDHAAVDADSFEHTVAALCARDGCTPVEVVGGAGDLGAYVIAVTVDGRRVVLRCKHYAEDNRVGSQDLQRIGGTCFTIHEADVAVLVTNSSFTEAAVEYAAACGLVCGDGDGLVAGTDQITPPPWEAPSAEPTATVPPVTPE